MGLFASSLFMVEARIKEIGIRKVVGATNLQVLRMITKNFTKWMIAANLIAYPIAYVVMSRWLENFAYRTSLNWWIFALAGVIALLIGLLTVSWQAVRAATTNPVKSLRYE
jgi:putative ABC transport system permease protein